MAKIMFVWPWSASDTVGQIIQSVEGAGEPTHVACVLDYAIMEAAIMEAAINGVILSPLDEYKARKHEIWELPVIHPEVSDAIVHLLVGRKYGWISCFAGLLRDKFGIKVPWVSTIYDNCSETGLIWLRGQTPIQPLFGIESPMSITPKDLYNEVKAKGGYIVEKYPQ
jgi:hypothetical protein